MSRKLMMSQSGRLAASAGSFPTASNGNGPGGATDLSVIEEGSYITSLASDSAMSRNSTFEDCDCSTSDYHMNGTRFMLPNNMLDEQETSSSVCSYTGDDLSDSNGIFRNNSKNKYGIQTTKLTAAVIASNTRSMRDSMVDSGDGDDDNDNEAVQDEISAVTQEPIRLPVSISQHKKQQKEHPSSSQAKADTKDEKPLSAFDDGCASCYITWLSYVPLWLKFLMFICLLLVLGSVSVGVVTSLQQQQNESDNDKTTSSAQDFPRTYPQIKSQNTASSAAPSPFTAAPTMQPTLSPVKLV